MKKIRVLAIVALLVLLFVGCKTAEPVEEFISIAPTDELKAAQDYLKLAYKNAVETTAIDYERVSKVIINEKAYPVVWTAEITSTGAKEDDIKFVEQENGMILVDINEKTPVEIFYNLTATIQGADGASATVEFTHRIPAAAAVSSYQQIVAAAYELETGAKMEGTYRLYGTVTEIPTAYSAKYGNITVNMVVAGMEDKVIQAYRLTGTGIESIKVGDRITVEGTLKDYKGTKEFDTGCKLIGFGEYPGFYSTVKAAFELETGGAMTTKSALIGTVTQIVTAFSEKYGNITVNMAVNGDENTIVQAYRLTGTGAAEIQVGDEICVYGLIKNYKGTVEFDSGCTLIDKCYASSIANVLRGYELETSAKDDLPCSITGKIVAIPTAYSAKYGNITVNLEVAGLSDNIIQAYRLTSGEDLAVGDIITVTGTLTNYKGTIEFGSGCTYTK